MDLYGLFAGIIAASIWGGMYVVSKVVLETIPPFSLLTLRLALGAITLLPFIVRDGGIQMRPKQTLQVLGIGFIGYGVSLGFQFIGTKLSTAANGALVTSATPAFVILFAAWFLKERITPRRIAALVIATVGVLLVIDPRAARITPDLFAGNLSLVGAAITWALYSVLIRVVTRGLAVLPVSFLCFLGGLPLTIPTAGIEMSLVGIGEFDVWIIAGVLYLGIISTGLAMYLWNLAFARLPASAASLTFFAQPVVGAGLGVLLLGEKMTPLFMLGGVLIAIGLILASSKNQLALSNRVE
jgi:drug/metabolite transporter (DMT)-like permease